MRAAFIGGTGLGQVLQGPEWLEVETPYGSVEIAHTAHPGEDLDLFLLPRHGRDGDVPAHQVEHRSNVHALTVCGVDAVLAVNNTGGLDPDLPPGSLIVPHDLVDLTACAPSLHDERPVHVDMTNPFCPELRDALSARAKEHGQGSTVRAEGVYVQTRGPRLETPAEVAFYASLGHVIGMTAGTEATLAREAGICYASLCFVSNPAAGLGQSQLDPNAIRDALAQATERVGEILLETANRIEADRTCACREAPERGSLA